LAPEEVRDHFEYWEGGMTGGSPPQVAPDRSGWRSPTTQESTIVFSLIIPTRGRPAQLRRSLDSIRHTAHDPASIEVIAIIDEDDLESQAFEYTGLRLVRILVPPGQTMGGLNLVGYGVARGRYLMLLNDDVIVRTSGWDTELARVFEVHPDCIVLAQVNDLVFRDQLCTFPVLTREFCELAGGICRPEYRRYGIDDHIHHVFDLIHLLGYTRRIFLPDVVFEHLNTAQDPSGAVKYIPEPAIHALDFRTFEDLLEERRQLALACVERIEGRACKEQHDARARFLGEFPDSIAIRLREHALWWHAGALVPAADTTTPRPATSLPRWLARPVAWLWELLFTLATRSQRIAKYRMGIPSALFDAEWYRECYPEVAAHTNPVVHYLKRGGLEGFNPNPYFDSEWYLSVNPDVAAAGINPLVHFVRYGAREGRNPSLRFDMYYYCRQYPKIAASGINPLEHFLSIGLAEGATPRPGSKQAPLRISVTGPVPLSVIIPTRNRGQMLGRMLEACQRHASGCVLEFVIVDDGSTDSTRELLCGLSTSPLDLRWQSLPPGGPGRARNLAATLARHDVLLFLGDDILPANDEFFRTHACRHAEYPEHDFAVLGKLEWPKEADFPINFTMRRIHEDGSQFAFSKLSPRTFVSWQFFYSSNLSVKKAMVRDWMCDGFDSGFAGAALEDMELAYRFAQSPQGMRIYYDPGSVGLHYHPYTLPSFLDRQYFVGRSLRRMLELHPELVRKYDAQPVQAALRQPRRYGDSHRLRQATAAIQAIKTSASTLEAQQQLGSEDWHGDFLSALFELCLFDGYASAWPVTESNLSSAKTVILDRFLFRMLKVSGKLPLSRSFRLSLLRRRTGI
jgi:glycosyltransferase involved in cell wall biosynthesis